MFCVRHYKLNTFYSFLTFVLRCHTVSRNFTVKYSQKVGQVLLRKAGTKYTGPNPAFSWGCEIAERHLIFCKRCLCLLLGCDVVHSGRALPTYRNDMLASFPELNFFSVPWKPPKYCWVFHARCASKSIWNLRFWYSGEKKTTWVLCNEEYVSLMLFENVFKGTL